jgi:hypothetical protein
VWLDARGVPARIELGEGDERRTVRLAAWRFTAPRGPAAFVLKAPPGVEVVDLP